MQEILKFNRPSRVVMHFKQDEEMAAKHGSRIVYYQAEIGGDDQLISPCGEFVRFNFASKDGEPTSEIHGWMKVDDILIDSVLCEFKNEEWLGVSHG